MIDWAISIVRGLIESYGAFGVFLASFIEEAVSFIPSSLIILFASFAILGDQSITANSILVLIGLVVIPVSLGLTLGSLVLYGIVYYLGEPFLRRFGKYIGISWRDIERLQAKMEEGYFDEIIFFIARSLPFIPFSLINAFCGLVRWPIKSYLLITFAGAFIRALIVGFLGWQLGWIYTANIDFFAKFEKIFLIIVTILLVAFVYYRRQQKSGSLGS